MNKKITLFAVVLLLIGLNSKAQKNEVFKTNEFANSFVEKYCKKIKNFPLLNIKKDINQTFTKGISLVDTVLIYDSLNNVKEKWVCDNNPNGNIETSTSFMLDTITNTWETMSRVVYTYDNNNNTLTEIAQVYFYDAWVDFVKVLNSYNDNKITNNNMQIISSAGWENIMNTDYIYKNDGNLDSVISMQSNNGVMENSELAVFTYNNNHILTITKSTWENNEWVEYLLEQDFIYNDNNLVLSKINKIFDSNQWILYCKFSFEYDSNGNNLFSEMKLSSADKKGWTNFRKQTYTFNENSYSTFGKDELFNGSEWLPYNNGNLEFFYKGKDLDYIDGFAFKTIFKGETIINNINSLKYELSPNPAKDFININFENESKKHIEIYDIKGVKVYQNPSNLEKSLIINTSEFENGLYFVKIISNGMIKTQKIIINK